jgi:type I restriction-modification system DNA methylase subunit
MAQIKLKTKTDVDFIMEMMSVFEKFEHQNKKYLSYLNTERKGDEAVVYEKIIIPLFTDVLNYDKHKDFNPQSTLSTGTIDNWIKNREGSPLIALEALRSNASQAEFIEHRQRLLSGYFDELGAKYAVLTNGVVFEVWNRIAERSKGLFVTIDFREIYTKSIEKGVKAFVEEDWRKISNLITLKKENQYLDVRKIYPEPQLDISEELHFNNFLFALQERMEEVKKDVLAKFRYLKGEYQECSELIEQYKERTFLKIRKRYERAQKFIQSFETWQKTSPNNTTPEAFCLETMYVFFNRVLLIRICEDKGIIPRKVSNGGIKKYIEYRGYIKFSQVDYKALFKEAYQIMNQFYPHLFQIDIFDWYEIDNDILLRVLFAFNPYNFSKVDRDILGKLYEKYLDRQERKRLGEFYTPEDVIDYILDAVGYTSESEIEGKKLLDPACGSGGFLVRATNIFVEKLKSHGFDAETILRKLQESIYGFDINPFACHLAETNLFFQVIYLIHQAKKNNPDFVMEKFNIYQTDSLRIPEEKRELRLFHGEISEYLIDTDVVKRIKLKQGEFKDGFDFVVGNPPYVSYGLRGAQKMTKEQADYLRKYYPKSAEYKISLYAIFMDLGMRELGEKGKLGFITADSFLLGRFFSKIRKSILDTCKISEIVLFQKDFWESGVIGKPVITILQKESDKNSRRDNNLIAKLCVAPRGLKEMSFFSYPYEQSYFNETLYNRFRLFFNETDMELVKKLEKDNVKLGRIINFASGLIGKRDKKSIISTRKENNKWLPGLLSGGQIERYSLTYKGDFILYDIKELKSGFKEANYFEPKIFLRQTGDSIITTYDQDNFLCLNNLHVGNLINKEYDIRYTLALLNSKLLTHYYHLISLELGRTMAQLDIETVEQLPIPPASPKIQQEFATLVNQILEINKNLPFFEAKVNNIQKLLEDFDFPLGDLADISEIKVELRDRIGKPRIKRERLKVFLDSKSYIECKNEYVANYIELYLESLGDTLRGKTNSEVVDLIRIPKSPAQLKKVLQKHQELLKQIEELKHRRAEIDREIDEKVYKLYGLTEEEIKIVKGSD